MTPRFLLGALFIAILAGAPRSAAADAPAQHEEETTELGEQMDRLSGAFRKLRRQAGDPALNASSLEQLAVMREAAQAAQRFVPVKAADLPEAKRAEFTAAYRKQMDRLLALLAETEAAFKAGDNTAAQKRVDELADLQKASHREYRKPKP